MLVASSMTNGTTNGLEITQQSLDEILLSPGMSESTLLEFSDCTLSDAVIQVPPGFTTLTFKNVSFKSIRIVSPATLEVIILSNCIGDKLQIEYFAGRRVLLEHNFINNINIRSSSFESFDIQSCNSNLDIFNVNVRGAIRADRSRLTLRMLNEGTLNELILNKCTGSLLLRSKRVDRLHISSSSLIDVQVDSNVESITTTNSVIQRLNGEGKALNSNFCASVIHELKLPSNNLNVDSCHIFEMLPSNIPYSEQGLFATNQIVPSHGSFIGWKKAYVTEPATGYTKYILLKLYIPADAKRLNAATSRKCRASRAKVLAAYEYTFDNQSVTYRYRLQPCKELGSIESYHRDFSYTVGEYAVPDSFDDDVTNVCSNGIHFFITKEEALDYIG